MGAVLGSLGEFLNKMKDDGRRGKPLVLEISHDVFVKYKVDDNPLLMSLNLEYEYLPFSSFLSLL